MNIFTWNTLIISKKPGNGIKFVRFYIKFFGRFLRNKNQEKGVRSLCSGEADGLSRSAEIGRAVRSCDEKRRLFLLHFISVLKDHPGDV